MKIPKPILWTMLVITPIFGYFLWIALDTIGNYCMCDLFRNSHDVFDCDSDAVVTMLAIITSISTSMLLGMSLFQKIKQRL